MSERPLAFVVRSFCPCPDCSLDAHRISLAMDLIVREAEAGFLEVMYKWPTTAQIVKAFERPYR